MDSNEILNIEIESVIDFMNNLMMTRISGSDLVDWLHTHVEGFADRRDARKYACNLLKAGYIRHTVNKLTFSEQCYYVFGDLCGSKLIFLLHFYVVFMLI